MPLLGIIFYSTLFRHLLFLWLVLLDGVDEARFYQFVESGIREKESNMSRSCTIHKNQRLLGERTYETLDMQGKICTAILLIHIESNLAPVGIGYLPHSL